jgi:hypothetical protein
MSEICQKIRFNHGFERSNSINDDLQTVAD